MYSWIEPRTLHMKKFRKMAENRMVEAHQALIFTS
jgi:hypothetical protein